MATIHEAIEVYLTLVNMGYAPVCPQLSMFAEAMFPGKVSYEKWLELDELYIMGCDSLIRLAGDSKGADHEVEYARKWEIPVYFGLTNFLNDVPEGPKEAACQ